MVYIVVVPFESLFRFVLFLLRKTFLNRNVLRLAMKDPESCFAAFEVFRFI